MKRSYLVLAALMIVIFAVGCAKEPEKKTFTTKLAADELDSAKFKEYFPLEYASYEKNKEMSNTQYGGSVRESKYVKEPQLPALFRGYGFEINYNEDRGHVYAIKDILNTKRINEKSPSSCWTCKATEVGPLIKKEGDSFYKVPFLDRKDQMKHPIGCPDCHDPTNMELRVTRPGLGEALKKQGIDISKATKTEMRSYVCGQCHVEYYFEKDTKKVRFPWDKGFEPEEIYTYYEDLKFSDWEHKDSKTAMLKSQHPDYEHWRTGTHGKSGVSCADCHMPYMKNDKGVKYTSHWMTSPLKNLEQSCLICHKAQGKEWLKERVLNIQKRTFELQDIAANTLVDAHKVVANSVYGAAYDKTKVSEAQGLIRKAQWYWDWVAAENGRGFHNPEQAMYILGQSINEANKVLRLMEKK